MATGKKWRYKHAGSNNKGGKWKGKHTCKVKEEVRVNVPAGEFDTYHIECKSKYTKRDYYIAPEVKTTVLYQGRHLRGRWRRYVYKLVSYDRDSPTDTMIRQSRLEDFLVLRPHAGSPILGTVNSTVGSHSGHVRKLTLPHLGDLA